MLTICSALLLSSAAALTTETSTVMTVTPAGVFPVTTTAPATATSTLAAISPNPSATATRWIYPNGAPGPWITDQVSVGGNGSFAWLGQNENAERVTLIASTDDQTPAFPIYEDLLTNADLVETAAADKAPICAVGYRNATLGIYEVRLYSAFSSVPIATAQVPSTGPLELAISDDGERVAAAYSDASGLATVDIFDTFGGSGLVYVTTIVGSSTVPFPNLREHDLSADGKVLLIGADASDQLFDATTGTPIFTDTSAVSVDAHAISADGRAFGRGGFDLGAWVATGSVYSRVLSFTDTSHGFGFFVSTACDISADGSTFVAAAYDALNHTKLRIYCFALTPTGSTLKWTFARSGTGSLQDVPQAVSVSDDGKYISVATWGTLTTAQPEVLVFDRDLGNTPIASIDTPGSAWDCDISGDGQFVIAGTKAIHANLQGNGGEGYSLDRGQQGFRLFGTTSIGRAFTLDCGGAPGETLLLAASFALLPVPITSPSFLGSFDLDPGTMFLVPTPIGTFPGSGLISLPVIMPLVPAGVGLTVYTQAIRTGGIPAIDNHLALPITP